LGVLREADAVAFCHAVTASPGELETVRAEVRAAGIERPTLVVVTKADEAEPGMLERLRAVTADLPVVCVSILDDASLEAFRTAVWGLTGLMRIHTRRPGSDRSEPLAVAPEATVRDVAAAIHGTLAVACRGGRVWGASVRYPGQLVGRDHSLAEDDVVELVT
jgi:ribosome-interacting GTPase 1